MISPQILQSKSLFVLLHQIDVDLAEDVRLKRCPSVGVLCITPLICVSLGEGLLILMRSTQSA
jgi:hypothetical protein